jgi:hypothetical protein
VIRLETCTGAGVLPHLPALARLRAEIFAEWPYLYAAEPAEESEHLRRYAEGEGAAVILAIDGAEAVGAATCQPMSQAAAAVREAFEAAGRDPARHCYFGESVLRREFRGQGLGVAFLAAREAVGPRPWPRHGRLLRRGARPGRPPPPGRTRPARWLLAPARLCASPRAGLLLHLARDRRGRAGAASPVLLAEGAGVRLACLSWPVEPLEDVAAYAARLDRWAGEAKASGADLLLLPEYAGLEIAPSGDAASELRAAVARAPPCWPRCATCPSVMACGSAPARCRWPAKGARRS